MKSKDSNSKKSVSSQKKDGRGHICPSFFWHHADNDKDLKVCFLVTRVLYSVLISGASTGGSDDIIDSIFSEEIIIVLLLWQLIITISLLIACFCWYHRRHKNVNKIDIAGKFHEIPQNDDKVTIKTETEKMETKINWIRSTQTMETSTSQDVTVTKTSLDTSDKYTPVTTLGLIPSKSLEIT